MGVNTKIPLPNDYQAYLRRALADGGTYEPIPTVQFIDQYNKIVAYNPSMVMFPSAKKTGFLYTLTPNTASGNFTSSRSSNSGSYFGSNGVLRFAVANEPRLNYNPTNRQFDGVLIEAGATNYFLYSQEFDNGVWTKADGGGTRVLVTSNQATAPDGTLTADLLLPSTMSANEHALTYNTSLITGSVFSGSFSWSIFVKPAGYNYFGLRTNTNNAWSLAMWNLQTGTTHSMSNNFTNHYIQKLPDNWYRVGITAPNATVLSLQHISSPDGTITFTGNELSGSFIWGAHLQADSGSSSYIPTTNVTVSRNADTIQSPLLNFTTTSWTVFFEIEYLYDYAANTGDVAGFNPGYVWYFRRLNSTGVNLWNQNAQQNLGSYNFSPVNSQKRFRCILSFNGSTINTFINGTKTGNAITPTNLAPYQTFFNGNIARIVSTKGNLAGNFDSSHVIKWMVTYNYQLDDQSSIFLTTL